MSLHRRLHHHQHASPHQNEKREPAPEPQVATSIVYVTAPQTFAGPAAYTTYNVGPPVMPSSNPQPTPQASIQNNPRPQGSVIPGTPIAPSPSPSPVRSSDSPALSSSLVVQSSPLSPVSSFVPETSIMRQGSTASNLLPSSTHVAASSSSSAEQSSGMSGGAKAGLALGILLGLGALLVALLFVFRRKKKLQQQEKQQQSSEKYGKIEEEQNGFGKSHFSMDSEVPSAARGTSVRTARTASTAPRLSLRPVTQFLPNLIHGDRKSQGNQLAMAQTGQRSLAPPAQATSHVNGGYGLRKPQTVDTMDPFGNHAEYNSVNNSPTQSIPLSSASTAIAPQSPVTPVPAKTAEQPLTGRELAAAMLTGETGAVATAPVVASTAAAAAISTAPKRAPSPPASEHDRSPPAPELQASPPSKPQPLNVNPASDRNPPPPQEEVTSPTGTTFSGMSEVPPTPVMSSGQLRQGPIPQVHRVQLDFKPSMEDEIELRAGQLVRLLHEYDDGWALCVRLDRSQQGVAPRTCLSTRPVKPRPMPPGQGPPRGPPPGMRGPPGRPMRPPMGPPRGQFQPPRPESPNGGRNSPGPYGPPRAMSPGPSGRSSPGPYGGPPRSMSPGPQGRPPYPQSPGGRSRSPSVTNQPAGPPRGGPGPSRMNPNTAPSPQRLPTVLRAASPGPGAREPLPSRKPVPGQAI